MPERTVLRIIVCDENEAVRTELKAIARTYKADVVEAETGQQALAALLVSDAQAAFVHVHLPDLSGFEVIRRVRAASLRVRPLFVALAGSLAPYEDVLVDAVGFDLRVARPVDASQISSVIASLRDGRNVLA